MPDSAAPAQSPTVKERLRKVIREMVLCGLLGTFVIILIGYWQYGHLRPGIIALLVVLGFVISPALWAAYRLLRFAVGG